VTLGDPDIHLFEQSGDDVSTRRQMPDSIEREAIAMKAELDELDRELAIMKEGPFGPNSEFMLSLPPNEREEVMKAMEEEGLEAPTVKDLLDDEDLEELVRDHLGMKPPKALPTKPPLLSVTLNVPVEEKIYVKRFNATLDTAQRSQTNDNFYALWKWYLRCRQKVSGFSLIIPEDVWHFLWTSQTTQFYRPKHVQILAQDMIKADVTLEDNQYIEYIDALQACADPATAVQVWESQKSRLGKSPEWAQLFWTGGIRLFVGLDQPRKAQRLLNEYFEQSGKVDHDLLFLVLTAWAKSPAENAEINTWSCYLDIRAKLEAHDPENSTPRILARINNILLQNGHRRLAIAEFKDMYLLATNSADDSLRLFKELGKGKDPVEANEALIERIGLETLTALPGTFNNKFFFAAWMKWLIADGLLNQAGMIVDIMYERGVKPDARPLNGLIAAMWRQGSALDLAEGIAWAMIRSRIKLVQDRGVSDARRESSEQISTADLELSRATGPDFLRSREAPAATIETFSILLQNMLRRSRYQEGDALSRTMSGPADIKPNSYILAHWIYASLRQLRMDEAWNTYTDLRPHVVPDLETFCALWDTGKAHYTRYKYRSGGFPTPRVLFLEMVNWLKSRSPLQQASIRADFSNELYEQIIRVFCLSYDLEGTFCAILGLSQLFASTPHEEVARLVIMHVARAHAPEIVKKKRKLGTRRLSKIAQYQSGVRATTEIVVGVQDRMIQSEPNINPEVVESEVDGPMAKGLRHKVLLSVIRSILGEVSRAKAEGAEVVERRIMAAAQEMGVHIPPHVLVEKDWNVMQESLEVQQEPEDPRWSENLDWTAEEQEKERKRRQAELESNDQRGERSGPRIRFVRRNIEEVPGSQRKEFTPRSEDVKRKESADDDKKGALGQGRIEAGWGV
jgi:hypothetical protein